jgi:hypothetical protein
VWCAFPSGGSAYFGWFRAVVGMKVGMIFEPIIEIPFGNASSSDENDSQNVLNKRRHLLDAGTVLGRVAATISQVEPFLEG